MSAQSPDRIAAVRAAAVVGALARVEPAALFRATRGGAAEAEARHDLAYHLHTACGISLSRVGVALGRDRSTISYAVAHVEERLGDSDAGRLIERVGRLVAEVVALGATLDAAEARVLAQGGRR